MDKCFGCSNTAYNILPCYHKVCNICLHDLGDGICLHYPDDNSDIQCLTHFTYDEVMQIHAINNNVSSDLCIEHNEPYTYAFRNCEHLYCEKCDMTHDCYDDINYSIEDWKKQTLIQMEKFKSKLNNKIKGLNCIIDILMPDDSVIKQIKDVIDTILIDITHIDRIVENINIIPISHLIKRKHKILNNTIVIPIDIPTNDIVDIIIKNELDIHADIDYAFQIACINGYLDIVKCLVKYGANINTRDNYSLRWASYNGHLDVVKYLIDHGANIKSNKNVSLRWASESGHIKIVELLIERGADIHTFNEWALLRACENGHLAVVECLIKNGADIHINKDLAYRYAMMHLNTAVADCLIKHGAAATNL